MIIYVVENVSPRSCELREGFEVAVRQPGNYRSANDAVFKYLLHLEADAVKNERDAFLAVVATVRVLLSKVPPPL